MFFISAAIQEMLLLAEPVPLKVFHKRLHPEP
jgi:hypothetical protein